MTVRVPLKVGYYYSIVIHTVYTAYINEDLTGIDWFEASSECGKYGLENNHNALSQLNIPVNEEFWIGTMQYKELTPWIEPIGCFSYEGKHISTSRKNSIGYCPEQCRSSVYFTYQKFNKECRCISREDLAKYTKAPLSSCKGHMSNRQLMVYKRFDYNVSNNNINTCIISKCIGKQAHQNLRLCNTTSSSIQVICDDIQPPETAHWAKNFTSAQVLCLKKDKFLMSPMSCFSPNGQFAWTSAFREVITVNSTLDNSRKGTPEYCLTAKRINISVPYEMKVTPRYCNDSLNVFVCKSGPIKEVETVEGDHIDTTANIGALIGGIIGGVITIATATISLLWIRRRRWQTAKSEGAESNTNKDELRNVKHAFNMQCGLVEYKTGPVHVPMYAVVQKDNKCQNKPMHEYAVVQKENKLSTSEDTYAITSEEEYDKLNNILSKKMNHIGNVYGIMGQCEEGEYDIMKGMCSSHADRADHLYDTNVFLSNQNENQTYDLSSNVQYKHNS